MLSTSRTLLSQSQYHGIAAPLDYVIVHGRPDLHERLQKEGLPTEMGTRMIWHEGPELSGATMALGLALGLASQNVRAFDLSRGMKPQASIREIFPWGELACECTIIAVMGLVLAHHDQKVHEEYSKADIECKGNRILALSNSAALVKEKSSLTAKLASIHDFLDSRVMWTTYARVIADCMPANVQIEQWQASNVIAKRGGRGAGGKSVHLTATAQTPDGMMPPEVGKFIASLRKNPIMKPRLSTDSASGNPAGQHEQGAEAGQKPGHAASGGVRGHVSAGRRQRRQMSTTESEERRAEKKSSLLERLHDPLQLRLIVTGTVLAIGYVAVYMPFDKNIVATAHQLDDCQKRLCLADDVRAFAEAVSAGRESDFPPPRRDRVDAVRARRRSAVSVAVGVVQSGIAADDRELSSHFVEDETVGIVRRAGQVPSVAGIEQAAFSGG